ncbi:unnamed protein product [Rotaria socialis]
MCVILINATTVSYATTLRDGNPQQNAGSTEGGTLLWIYGTGFAENHFSMLSSTETSNAVQLTQGNDVQSNTPYITKIIPASGLPQRLVTLYGDFKSRCYLREFEGCSEKNSPVISRIYIGGQLCNLIDPNSVSYDIHIPHHVDRVESQILGYIYKNTSHIKKMFQGRIQLDKAEMEELKALGDFEQVAIPSQWNIHLMLKSKVKQYSVKNIIYGLPTKRLECDLLRKFIDKIDFSFKIDESVAGKDQAQGMHDQMQHELLSNEMKRTIENFPKDNDEEFGQPLYFLEVERVEGKINNKKRRNSCPDSSSSTWPRILTPAIINENNCFSYDGQCYHQTQGVAIGSLLTLTMSNCYTVFYEHYIVKQIKNKNGLYYQYIDDIFIAIDWSARHLLKQIDMWNHVDENIKLSESIGSLVDFLHLQIEN